MLCGCCSSKPQPGTFAYEVFQKLPQIPKGGISSLIGNRGSVIPNMPNNFPNKFPQNFDPNAFINNVPANSVKGNDSNLKELIEEKSDNVIKKVFKSNYS